jgi:hypothetical protein
VSSWYGGEARLKRGGGTAREWMSGVGAGEGGSGGAGEGGVNPMQTHQ